jgi:hypothetical protein
MVTKLMRLAVYSVCLGAPAQAHAQRLADVTPATRLRLQLPDSLRQAPLTPRQQFVTGQFVRATADSVYLQMAGAAPFGVARAGVPMWVSLGVSRGRSALRAGAALGLLGATVIYTDGRQGRYHQNSDAMVAGAIGLGVGVILGAVSPWERWRRLRSP